MIPATPVSARAEGTRSTRCQPPPVSAFTGPLADARRMLPPAGLDFLQDADVAEVHTATAGGGPNGALTTLDLMLPPPVFRLALAGRRRR